MHPRKSNAKVLWLCVALVFAVGCNHLGGTARPTTPAPSSIGPAAREYLASSEEEEEGYGFYSYLLLPKAARDPATVARYRAAFDAFLRIIPKQQQRLQPAALNLAYALVLSEPPESVRAVMAGALPNDPRRTAAVEWLIENHDYARSAAILRSLHITQASGPFILQAPQPVASMTDANQVLVQDLTGVETNLVGEIVDHTLEASDEKQSWSDDELESYLMQVRNFWERLGINAQRVAALVSWVPVDKLLGS